MKKANAIAEYGILIFIVIATVSGVHFMLRRHFQGYIQTQVDTHLRQPIPFLWQSSVKFTKASTNYDRLEAYGGDTVTTVDSQNPYTTLSAPAPPGAPTAGLHAQDAALAPPQEQNPQNPREDIPSPEEPVGG